jgi:C4-dicarboxylate transporter, DctQ subunit
MTMNNWSKWSAWLRARAENLAALMLASMFATFLIQVVFRYLLNLPLGWTVEYVAIAWLWGILFGFAFVVRDEDIIRLDLIYNVVPVWLRRAMDVFANLVAASILAWSLPKAYEYVTFMAIEKTAYMQLRFDLVFSIYIPFVIAVIIRCLLTVWHALRGDRPPVDPLKAAESEEYV